MKIKYGKETDSIYLRFSDAEVAESDEDKPGIIIDYDKDGKLWGSNFWTPPKELIIRRRVVHEVD